MPNCDATCKPWWYYDKYIEQQCSHQACVEIDGLNLCMKHAGAIAVRKLINNGEAKQIPKLWQKGVCDLGRH